MFAVESTVAFWNIFYRQSDYIDAWIIKITSKQIKSNCMFASFKSRLHTKGMFVP